MDRRAGRGFYEILRLAIADITEHGFDTSGRLDFWTEQLRQAAMQTMGPIWRVEELLKHGLSAIFKRLVDRDGIGRYHRGMPRFTLERVAPHLRAELDRRTLASANLVKLNREQVIAKTLQRFQGWATSIPGGGSDATDKQQTAKEVRKALARLPFEERRVLIDQGHKFTANLSNILAQDGGAIALIWRSHWRQLGYDYRPDHKERDGQVYALKGNWAIQGGLMRAGEAGYYEDITAVGEEVFCRCYATYLYGLRDLPADMLTKKGFEELARAKTAA
jgi:hypothetical protein